MRKEYRIASSSNKVWAAVTTRYYSFAWHCDRLATLTASYLCPFLLVVSMRMLCKICPANICLGPAPQVVCAPKRRRVQNRQQAALRLWDLAWCWWQFRRLCWWCWCWCCHIADQFAACTKLIIMAMTSILVTLTALAHPSLFLSGFVSLANPLLHALYKRQAAR